MSIVTISRLLNRLDFTLPSFHQFNHTGFGAELIPFFVGNIVRFLGKASAILSTNHLEGKMRVEIKEVTQCEINKWEVSAKISGVYRNEILFQLHGKI